MSKAIAKHRLVAFIKQSECCYYCGSPMWLNNPDEYAEKYRLSKKSVKRFQCTAEHLHARCDGGGDGRCNIVAACLFCNSNRHKRKKPPTPERYRRDIRNRLKRGKWIPQHQRPRSAVA